MDLEEIREHKTKAEHEIAVAITEILNRLTATTGLATEALMMEGSAHCAGNVADRYVITSVQIDLGKI